MGIEPFLVGSALDCVLAQRLARRLCSKCKEAVHADRRESLRAARYPVGAGRAAAHAVPGGRLHLLRQDRLQGRLALHEVMQMTETLERLTVERASTAQIEQVARSRGHGVAAAGRDGQGARRGHVAGRDPARRGVTVARSGPLKAGAVRTMGSVHRFDPSLGRRSRSIQVSGRPRALNLTEIPGGRRPDRAGPRSRAGQVTGAAQPMQHPEGRVPHCCRRAEGSWTRSTRDWPRGCRTAHCGRAGVR